MMLNPGWLCCLSTRLDMVIYLEMRWRWSIFWRSIVGTSKKSFQPEAWHGVVTCIWCPGEVSGTRCALGGPESNIVHCDQEHWREAAACSWGICPNIGQPRTTNWWRNKIVVARAGGGRPDLHWHNFQLEMVRLVMTLELFNFYIYRNLSTLQHRGTFIETDEYPLTYT